MGIEDVKRMFNECGVKVRFVDVTPCKHCGGEGEIETDNNGPIVPCPICRPETRNDR